MTDAAHPNAQQETFWDIEAGPKWVRLGQGMDALLRPVLDAVLDRAALLPGQNVLDIGCGGGTSTFDAARIIGPGGRATGADISHTLLHQARARASAAGIPNVEFMQCDAETHGFDAAAYDAMISRFGVMFFANSEAAFENIAKSLKPGAQITFAAWGEIAQNPFFTLPAAVARAHFGASLPKTDPDAPGPFAFRDPARVRSILTAAGLTDVQIDVQSSGLSASEGGAALARLCAEIGPVERAFIFFEATPEDRKAVQTKLADAFDGIMVAGDGSLPAQINIVTALVP